MMALHRFYLPPASLIGNRAVFSPEQSFQMTRVLRLRPGSLVEVFDGSGQAWLCRLTQVSSSQTWGEVVEPLSRQAELPFPLILIQALLKGEKLEWVLQKAAELGVSAILLVKTERSIVHLAEEQIPRKLARWEKIVQEAVEQARRTHLPSILYLSSFSTALEWITKQKDSLYLLIPYEEEQSTLLWNQLKELPSAPSIAVFIGPEGGFSPLEVQQLKNLGGITVSLGPRILRSETAAITALACISLFLEQGGIPSAAPKPEIR